MFTPAEAETLTGLGVSMQRDYRKRGFYREVQGHARYGLFEIAEMRLDKLLSDGGMGPGAGSRLWRRAIAYTIASQVLRSPSAYKGEVEPSEGEVTTAREALITKAIGPTHIYTGDHLPAGITNMVLTSPRFAMWWGEGRVALGNSIDSLHESRSGQGIPTLPFICLDLHGVATDLLREGGWFVEFMT